MVSFCAVLFGEVFSCGLLGDVFWVISFGGYLCKGYFCMGIYWLSVSAALHVLN